MADDDDKGASRCSICATNWPIDFVKTCPECDEELSRMQNASPISLDEARSRRAHIEFEKFYASRSLQFSQP